MKPIDESKGWIRFLNPLFWIKVFKRIPRLLRHSWKVSHTASDAVVEAASHRYERAKAASEAAKEYHEVQSEESENLFIVTCRCGWKKEYTKSKYEVDE